MINENFQYQKLEPEGPNTPSFQRRAEDAYDALSAILGNGRLGQCNFTLDKVQIESLMGLLSHRFEGCF